MKRLTTFAFLVLSINAFSQVTKDTWMLGGYASFSQTRYESEAGSKVTGFAYQIAPDLGYFLADKFAAGLRASISKIGSKATGTSVYASYTDANFGPFLRYYFLPVDKQINITAEGTYQYGLEGGSKQRPKNTFSLTAGPVAYFNSGVGLEFLIGYSSTKVKDYNGRNGSLLMGLGLQVHLERENNY